MDIEEAEEALSDAEVVACAQAPLPEAKELREAFLAAEIPVLLDRGECCGSSGCRCAPKMQLFVRSQDLPRVADLMQERWRALALREGTVDADHPTVAPPASEEPPCPACGAVAALVVGACADCGLQLE